MNHLPAHWAEALVACREHRESCVLVTVVEVRGSAPRETGAKMLITATEQVESIGGGHLELIATRKARSLLAENRQHTCIEHYPLGASLGQCCGGHMTLLFEVFAADACPVVLFGAGHVGRALVSILGQLPVSVTWVDSREDAFPASLPANVTARPESEPLDAIADMAPGSLAVVMTHRHSLDFAIGEALLKRGDCRYVGVIGSDTKSRRFRARMQNRGLDARLIDSMQCPIGFPGITGKRPMEVAVAVAAELMTQYRKAQVTEPAETAGNESGVVSVTQAAGSNT